jgi:hypothetical protein
MPTIDLTDAEHAAITALIRRAIEDDKFPLAPHVDTLRSAFVKLDPAVAATLRRPPAAESAKPAPHNSPEPPKAGHGAPEGQRSVRRSRA